ncbi:MULTISPECIES: type VII secretion protein EccE [Mycolicibacterium]|uniref:type VII secretion protein EccE n=1 Tax=Mycolicibacterium TaxID=1866885 RepID=UPI0007EB26A1|nr:MULTISPECIES: type VII secretion protein EccE [Mycolicibacterium]OBB25301.1 type VII secretion protein EccE [Mycolicibacterium fortuitum]OBB47961.1 type VII secretion protein EccE [Mycolicibacterium fortuitum]OBB62256.1 type VII secretion protein EccE [Mycolicibacterium fortuitum]OBF70742.1 type VII secretion protein EccE [Mycolicibacterium fortuitum]OBG10162.1 type VII secretion protein EccE [Mycolicibacterium fortuitum]
MRPLAFAAKLTTAGDTGPQRLVPLADLIALQIVVAVGIVVALGLDRPGWQGAVAGLVMALLLVSPLAGGTTLPRALGLRWGFLRNRRRRTGKNAPGPLPTEPFDVPTPDGLQIGFRWNGTTLLSLLKIDENPRALTVLEPGVTVSGEMVPVQALLDCLRQFDITLESIDIISQGARSAGHTDVAAVYDSVLGPLPAIAQRTVWIAVRFNPSRCAEAVRRRGGDRDGILRAATTATRRVANRLAEAGLQPQFLSASGIAAATNQLSDGVSLGTVEETWEDCREGQFRLSSFAVQPDMLTTAGLGLLWTVPSYSTTVCLSLREAAEDDLVQVRGLVRFDSDVRVPTQLRGLVPLHGRQFSALAATLPIPALPGARQIEHWASGLRADALDELALPASGCGQVIGADQEGRAVALPLFGPQIRRVEIAGTLHLAQQVVLRSLALGARVLVHTRRPAFWRDMVDVVGRHDLLWVADFNRRALQAGSERNYTVEMFDGVPEQSVRIGVTAMVVAPPNTPASEQADVVLDLISLERDTVKVSTQAGSAVVTMVATDDEMRYLRASANCTD